MTFAADNAERIERGRERLRKALETIRPFQKRQGSAVVLKRGPWISGDSSHPPGKSVVRKKTEQNA